MEPIAAERAEAALDLHALADMLGTTATKLASVAGELIARADLRYAPIQGAHRDHVIRQVLSTLASDLPRSGPGRAGDWERGWGENLAAFRASGGDLGALIPRYYRRGRQPMRLAGSYILPAADTFELDVLAILRAWIGAAFLAEARDVYEFGCGPAHNLAALAQRYPDRTFWGLDWSEASVQIVAALSARHGLRVRGAHFDMLVPRADWQLTPGAAVLTMGALEQLGTSFRPFVAYVLDQRPAVCVHVEPIDELYDRGVLFDDLAARYAERRGYLTGFLTHLRELERRGRLHIRHVKKNLGSLYHDGWTTVVWSPR